MTRFTTKALTPRLWPMFEKLFEGANGVCGGCWCMWWRVEGGKREYEAIKGSTAKRRIKALVLSGKAHGMLAFSGKEPVGWCSYERRADLPSLDATPSLGPVDDADEVWSIPCFFVKAGFRGKGVAKSLLAATLKHLRTRHRGEPAEAYPVRVPKGGASGWTSALYTGTVPLFEKQGFDLVQIRPRGRQRVRRKI